MSGNAAPCALPVIAAGCSHEPAPARKIAWLNAGVVSSNTSSSSNTAV
jgi:hypothetical protein